MSNKIEKQLQILKKLHTPETRTVICRDYNISDRTFRNYFNGGEKIKLLNVEFNHQIKEVEQSRDIYLDGRNQEIDYKKDNDVFYKSSVHPVLLPLNMTEVYMLTQGILDILDKDSVEYEAYKGIAEKIYSQLSEYGIKKLGENRHNLEKKDVVTYESELEMYERLHKLKFLYAEKSRDIVKVIFEDGEFIIGRIDRRGRRLVLTHINSRDEIDINNFGSIKNIEII